MCSIRGKDTQFIPVSPTPSAEFSHIVQEVQPEEVHGKPEEVRGKPEEVHGKPEEAPGGGAKGRNRRAAERTASKIVFPLVFTTACTIFAAVKSFY